MSAKGSGGRIRDLRGMLDMSQRELAQILDIRQATVSGWETGKQVPEPGNLRLVADLCEDSRLVHRWLLGEGPRPQLRRHDPEDRRESAGRSYGFRREDLPVGDATILRDRAETSYRLCEELGEGLPLDEDLACAREASEAARKAFSSARQAMATVIAALERHGGR